MAAELDQIPGIISDLWALHKNERVHLDTIRGYVRGEKGKPELPEGSSDDVKALQSICVKNVLSLVVDSFVQNLAIVGFRTAEASSNEEAWQLWQRNRMDARQGEIFRSALTYGVAYVAVVPSEDGAEFRIRTPRQMICVYNDPELDEFPRYALETWTEKNAFGKKMLHGLFYDDTYIYPVVLGEASTSETVFQAVDAGRIVIDTPIVHKGEHRGRAVTPVVRFINNRDAEDIVRGEVEPLIDLQRAINAVNLDRLIVSRFGAFPQKVISGWTAQPNEILAASASRVWTFEDENVKASTLAPGSVDPYNSVLEEMMEHVAMVAQISPSQVTGKMINLSADALAAGEANQQRKLWHKRDSLGESAETMLRLGAVHMDDIETVIDEGAEVIWRDTEARSFATVVDGVTKLSSQGIPIDELLVLVPGLTQAQITAIKNRVGGTAQLVEALRALGERSIPPAITEA